jgi:hypothetical protein
MASTPKKLVRPTTRTPTEDADPVGCASGARSACHRRPQDHRQSPPRTRLRWCGPRIGDVVRGILGSAFIRSAARRSGRRTVHLWPLRNANTSEPTQDQAAKIRPQIGDRSGREDLRRLMDSHNDARLRWPAGGVAPSWRAGPCGVWRRGCDMAFSVIHTIKGLRQL